MMGSYGFQQESCNSHSSSQNGWGSGAVAAHSSMNHHSSSGGAFGGAHQMSSGGSFMSSSASSQSGGLYGGGHQRYGSAASYNRVQCPPAQSGMMMQQEHEMSFRQNRFTGYNGGGMNSGCNNVEWSYKAI